MQITTYLPFVALFGLVSVLLVFPRVGLAKPAVVAALLALAAAPEHIGTIVARVGPSLLGVLIMMSAVQLAVAMMMDERGTDWLGHVLAYPLRSERFADVPASVLVPIILMPLAMACAAMIHNIPAVALLAPITFSLCQRVGIPWIPSLVGLIPASNLGGASAAWGDTPAIIQRQIWGFDVSTFAINMLPRNLLMLAILMGCVACWSYFSDRCTGNWWRQEHERIRLREQNLERRIRSAGVTMDQILGTVGLVGLFFAQMLSPAYALALSMAILAGMLAFRAGGEFVRSTFVLGEEAVLAIAALFVISAAIEHSPLLNIIAERLMAERNGGIEMVAFFITSLISADGAAAMLAPVVHARHDGSLQAAWALASGICAGSTTLLTSASAGPILMEAAKRCGAPMSFRIYAAFGIPFSLIMLGSYLLLGVLGWA